MVCPNLAIRSRQPLPALLYLPRPCGRRAPYRDVPVPREGRSPEAAGAGFVRPCTLCLKNEGSDFLAARNPVCLPGRPRYDRVLGADVARIVENLPDHVRVRRRLRASGADPALGQRLRLGAHRARASVLCPDRGDRTQTFRRWLRGRERRRPGVDGGRQQRRVRRQVPKRRAQYPPAAGAARQPLPQRHPHLPALLRAQGNVREIRQGLRGHARRLRHAR